ARHFDKPELRLVEARPVAFLVRDADQADVAVVRPRVVEALKGLRVAAVAAADRRAAVDAAVREDAHAPGRPAADEEERSRADGPPGEVAGLRDLGLVAEVEPAATEDVLDLRPVQRLGGQRRPVVGEVALLLPLDDQIRELHRAPFSETAHHTSPARRNVPP